eukprot:2845534-Alexandrium_andersonii.AAC.1
MLPHAREHTGTCEMIAMKGNARTFGHFHASMSIPAEVTQSGRDYAPNHPAASHQLHASLRDEGPLP